MTPAAPVPTADQFRFAELVGMVEAVGPDLSAEALDRLRRDSTASMILDDPTGVVADLVIDHLSDLPAVDWVPLRNTLLAAALVDGGRPGARLLMVLRCHCTDRPAGTYGGDAN
ncbi:hypothetical protein DVS28_b0298 (plasmid) [Euzebya pacifica]|uniref:Uncharacterized protein n=1 Tax=Euzebya pacifica TaxID=1608957 RepID=A0A346Y6H1_9ACTN|nr:hypothetical protein [Euzebya pacifica]AXV10068.1 hypothetical protein DVS28_b0298 [Euzebya pacifica]